MKFVSRILLPLPIALAATLAFAQTIPVGTFKHIIIVIMENRTPDNLFGAAGATLDAAARISSSPEWTFTTAAT